MTCHLSSWQMPGKYLQQVKYMYSYLKQNAVFLRIIGSSSLGTILEWYDFSLFAFLTPILAKNFFPPQNSTVSLMLTYAIFALGFFVRPLGAVLMGHLGDRIGRRRTLIISILLMTVPTFFIGLLPTYAQAGLAAPIMLVLLRICQGLSAGGESIGAALFVMESGNYKNRGFLGAVLWGVVGIGMLAGSFAASAVITHPQYAWAWRVPFLLGIFTGFIGYFVRKRTPESLYFTTAKRIHRFPLLVGIKNHKIEMLRILGFYSLSAMITYFVIVFMPAYVVKQTNLPLAQVTYVGTWALATSTLLAPLGGYLSDCVGRKICLRWAASGIFMLSYPLFCLLTSGSLKNVMLGESIFLTMTICYQGALTAAAIEQLPTAVRYSVIAVSYNLANSIFGGAAPLLASVAASVTGDKAGLAFFLMFGAALAVMSTYRMRETYLTAAIPA
jgi:MHS family proline/betaine transporter-like MFS transporter